MYENTKVLGNSEIFLEFQEKIYSLARVDRPVLLLGERGTGKEMAAYNLHYLSKRWEKPYIVFLCSALNPNLLEDALFGHEAGSFTGASSRSIGYFERANHGSIFLDEVADLPLATQDKLLRVLEYGTFERIGGQKTIQVDLKIIAATNKNIFKMAEDGLFRPDLLDRLNFESIEISPLRARSSDIILLASHFAINMANELGISGELEFSDFALKQLFTHAWYGNVRELKNVVERSVYRLNSLQIDKLFLQVVEIESKTQNLEQLNNFAQEVKFTESLAANFSLNAEIKNIEQKYLDLALEQSKFKQTEAAKLLGLSYHQFRNLYKKHNNHQAKV